MIKYIGSKRRLVPVLADICATIEARRALDLFTGTTRVAQAFKQQGAHVTAVDTARYAEVFAQCYVEIDADRRRSSTRSSGRCADLMARPDVDGYVTEVFCTQSRGSSSRTTAGASTRSATRSSATTATRGCIPVLLTSLLEAADRVDSTTGVQMAYVKQWAPRSFQPLQLRVPELLAGYRFGGAGRCLRGRRRSRIVRPRVPRPAVQPAPVLHELSRVGDDRRVGRARALRRGLQAPRRARSDDEERVQRAAGTGPGAGAGRTRRRRRRRGGLVQQRVVGADRGAGRDGRARGAEPCTCSSSTPAATLAP